MSLDKPEGRDPVTTFYARDPEYVWERTDTEARIEGALLRRIVAQHLPPHSAVADIGGGNGRFAFELAEAGHRVRLCDVTPELVADATVRDASATTHLDETVVADARSLPWSSGSADAALMLGPLYCLSNEEDRAAALSELRRVLRPGGVGFLQFFTRVGGLRSLMFWAIREAGLFDWESYLESGRFTGGNIPEFHRSVHYWHSLNQIDSEVSRADLRMVALHGMDGPAPEAQELLGNVSDELIDQWVDISLKLSSDKRTLYCSNHVLAVVAAPTVGDPSG